MKILMVTWDSGGGVEVSGTVVSQCVAAGHEVRVLGTAGLRDRFERCGATFRTYQHAPENDRSRPETDLLEDWKAKSPLDSFIRVRDRLLFGPAELFCRDVTEELDSFDADVVMVDILIASALCAAEARRIPRVLLVHALYGIPRPGATPMGGGFMPARGPFEWARAQIVQVATKALLHTGLKPLNRARATLGLAPYDSPLELFSGADRILDCTSPTFDFDAGAAPDNLRYVGPQFDHSAGGDWDNPWEGQETKPIVLVGLSSTYMDQRKLLQLCADALGRLPVHGLITTGPTVDPAVINAPPGVIVRQWVRHLDVLPHCAVVVTHGGHGTVTKTLEAGVPLVVIPMGRDQPDNAARVVHAGAGVRITSRPTVDRIEAAVSRVLAEPLYEAKARQLARAIAAERIVGAVVRELEDVTNCSTVGGAVHDEGEEA